MQFLRQVKSVYQLRGQLQRKSLYLNGVRYMTTVKDLFPDKSEFPTRHIGPRKTDVVSMLDLLGFKVRSLGQTIVVPELQKHSLFCSPSTS